MKTHLIHTDNYWCAFDLGVPKGDKSVGIISRVDEKTGMTAVLASLDEHGIGLVAELADKLVKAEKRKTDVETMLEAAEKRNERALSLLNDANAENVWDVIGRLKVVISGDYRSEAETAAAADKGE